MARVTFWMNDSDNFISVEAEEFHEDDGFFKAYTRNHELVAVVSTKYVKAAYRTETKERDG